LNLGFLAETELVVFKNYKYAVFVAIFVSIVEVFVLLVA
jgi:hypothetical protein